MALWLNQETLELVEAPERPPDHLATAVGPRGRRMVYAAKGVRHPEYFYACGWQRLARYIAMVRLGRRLRFDEHAHHSDLQKTNDSPENIEVLLAEYHGSLHASHTLIARKGDSGPVELEKPGPTQEAARRGPVIGPAARDVEGFG